ncbi:MAG: ABC transporter transmembrane domain-containing protein [Chitinophagales bacterium]|nr:ABC transporter transmembrane domain-containing protein [Chitinophagales bacterium]
MPIESTNLDAKRKVKANDLKRALKVFRFMLPYKWTYALGLLFLVFSITSGLLMPFLISKLIDEATGQGSWYVKGLNNIVLLIGGLVILQATFSFVRIYTFDYVTANSIAGLRKQMYDKILNLPVPFFEERRVGELISRLTSDISRLEETMSVTLAEFLRQIATLIIGIAFLLHYSPKLTGLMLLSFPLIVLLLLVFGRFIRKLSKKVQDNLAATNVIVDETFHAINTVKAYTNENYEKGRYAKSIESVVLQGLKLARYRGAFISLLIVGLFGGIVFVLWEGALQVQSGQLTIGGLTGFVFYTIFIAGSLAGLGELYSKVQSTIGGTERILEILDEPQEDYSQKVHLNGHFNYGSIAFKEVRFSYPSRPDVAVMKGINFEIANGEKIALVGPSGAGKSTITQLLLGYYKVSSGQILVNGISIYDMGLENLRKKIGIVPQEVSLFGGSIRENIAYGDTSATEAQIIEAAKKANAWSFIQSFPDGLETLVGERGVKLSGGQKQRIAIARAILKNPAILVLDEATSSLDAESEVLVQEALEGLMENRTSIVIAHRLSTIRKADRIFVINEGQIIETGTHEQLLENDNGLYSHLLKLQFNLK